MTWKVKRFVWGCSAAMLVGVAIVPLLAADNSTSAHGGASSTSKASSGQRLREGAQMIDVLGHFKITGDRATFYPVDSQTWYAGLENLNLERITQVTDNTDQMVWQVSGTITEFRGSNYLLITKAILKSHDETPEAAPKSRAKTQPKKRNDARN